jgi:tRNA pseudouridine38-40 synthase
MPRIALGVAYDGSAWHGWQTQSDGNTVQDSLEAALAEFLAQPTPTVCAGRTDAGVHALGQIVHLDTTAERRPESWIRGLNSLLPRNIAVQWARETTDDFHARFSAVSRTYAYILRNSRIRPALQDARVGWAHRPLDLDRMRLAAQHLVGEHDFSCFRSSQCQAASPVRTLSKLDITRHGDHFLFVFKANAFLHHMVRNLMGALIYVGQGRQEPDWMVYLLAQRDRRLAAPTFSPHGLYLVGADYPPQFALPEIGVRDALLSHLGYDFPLP